MTSYPKKIEEFTKEQTISYLAQYPNGLKAEALRQNLLESLTLSEIEAMLKEDNPCIPKDILREQASSLRQIMGGLLNRRKPEVKPQKDKPQTLEATSFTQREKVVPHQPKSVKKIDSSITPSSNKDRISHDNAQIAFRETISKIILTILVVGIAIGIVILFDSIDINMDWIKIPFCLGGVAVLKMIWN